MAMFESEYELYHEVIEDVIKNLKDVFFDEGTDESVLQELKQIWKSRLELSKAVDPPVKKPAPLNSNVYKFKNGLPTQQLPQQSTAQSGSSATSNLIGIRLSSHQQAVANNPVIIRPGQGAVSLQHPNQQQLVVSGQRTITPSNLLNQKNIVLNNNSKAPNQMIIVQGTSNSPLIGQRFILPQQTQGMIGSHRLLSNIQLVNSTLAQQQIVSRPILGQQIVSQPILGHQVVNQPILGHRVINQQILNQQVVNQHIFGQQVVGQQIVSQPVLGQQVIGQQIPLQRLQHMQIISQVPARGQVQSNQLIGAQVQPNQLITVGQQPRIFPAPAVIGQPTQLLQVVRPSQNLLTQFHQVSGSNLTNIRLTGLSSLQGVTAAAGAKITLQMANNPRPAVNNNIVASSNSNMSSSTTKLRQLDGPLTMSDDDGENLDDDDELSVVNNNVLSDVSDDDPIPEEDEDIEAQYIQLTEEDDIETTDASELFDVDNLLVCLYDSVKKEKKKPKYTVHLKLGILSINGKDTVFKSAYGEFQF